MPELPEVHTIVVGAKHKLVGKTFKSAEIKFPKLVGGDIDFFKSKIVGAKIKGARRFGKIIVLDLSSGFSLLIHLKLTGQLVLVSKGAKGETEKNIGGHLSKIYEKPLPHAHTHAIFKFTDGSHLYFNDLMKFGYIKPVKTDEVESSREIKSLGPDPIGGWNFPDFEKSLDRKRRSRIKLVLMDQSFVSGIGNIYANEILFYARVRPERTILSLSDHEKRRVYDGIIFILKKGVELGGSSENTYVNLDGKKGNFMDYAKVYQQKTCKACGGPIKRISLGGRGTHYCPACQK